MSTGPILHVLPGQADLGAALGDRVVREALAG
jgi:hypothetical protein